MALDDPDLPMEGLVPAQDELSRYAAITVRPHGREEWEHSFLLPEDWHQEPPPSGKPSVKNPGEFVPLGVYTPTRDWVPPVVFSVGVRPAPRRGSVAAWLEEQCHVQQLVIQRMAVHTFLFGPAADAVALQGGDLGRMKLRVTMFEDGERLFALTAIAPMSLWEAFVAPLSLAIVTFELSRPRGQTVPVLPKPPEPDTGSKAPAPAGAA